MPASLSTRHRPAFRAAVGSAVLLGALVVPAAAAYADSTATPVPTPTTSAGDKGGGGQGPVKPAGVLVHTDALKGGLKAAVYRFGSTDTYYSADITKGGKVLGSLTAGFGHQATATHVYDDISVTLYANGHITSAADKGGGGQGPVTPVKCVVTHRENIGAGTTAWLTISPSGPSVRFQASGEKGFLPGLSLDRTHPKLTGAEFLAEILHPSSATPQLETRTQGGTSRVLITDFPRLPKGCSFTYATTNTQGGAHQTTVVPQGSVAAGYEAPAGDGHSTLIAVGGAAGLGAAGVAFVALRRRSAGAR